MENKSKPGIQSTEFWISVAPVLGGLIEGMKGDPETGRYLIMCGTILGGLYIVSRTIVKFKGYNHVELTQDKIHKEEYRDS